MCLFVAGVRVLGMRVLIQKSKAIVSIAWQAVQAHFSQAVLKRFAVWNSFRLKCSRRFGGSETIEDKRFTLHAPKSFAGHKRPQSPQKPFSFFVIYVPFCGWSSCVGDVGSDPEE